MIQKFTLALLLYMLSLAPLRATLVPAEVQNTSLSGEELHRQIREYRAYERATLSGRERLQLRRERRRALRQTVKDYRRGEVEASTVLYALLALILPPLAVYLVDNQTITGNFWLNVLLVAGGVVLTAILGSFLWFLPAIVHALMIVFSGR